MPNTTVPAAAEGVPADIHIRNRVRELAYEISSLLDRVPLAAALNINPASSPRSPVMLCQFIDHGEAKLETVELPNDPWRAAEFHGRKLAEVMANWPDCMRFSVTIRPHDAEQRLFWVCEDDAKSERRQLQEVFDLYQNAEKEFSEGIRDDREMTAEELSTYEAWGKEVTERSREALHDLLSFRCQHFSTRQAQAEMLLRIYRSDRWMLDIGQMETLLESIAGH